MLESQIRRTVARAFRGRLLTGTLRRFIPGEGTDPAGDPLPGHHETFSFEGIRENLDARYKAQAGIPETDVAVLVILGSVSPETMPGQDDQVFIRGQWHQVRQVLDIDPANASARLQCFEISDPTGD